MTDMINAIVVPSSFNLPLWTAQKKGFLGDGVPEALGVSPRVERRNAEGPCGAFLTI